MELIDFSIGDRVEISPALDLWMMGARFGGVVGITKFNLLVQLDLVKPVKSIKADYIFRNITKGISL